MSTPGINPNSSNQDSLMGAMSHQRMQEIAHKLAEMTAESKGPSAVEPTNACILDTTNIYFNALMESLRDGVIMLDAQCNIKAWSQSVEIMTGMISDRVINTTLTPKMLNLHDSIGTRVKENECPIAKCIRTGKASRDEYKIIGRSGREIKIELMITPVAGPNETVFGAIVQLHDASIQTDLQRQLKDLYQMSVMDPLTKVANRAEFERVLDEFLKMSQTSKFECSLIICDIDFFKSINDNYGHHIGDQALVAFAQLLKKFVRAHDMVARYGGEEFVILCADCDVDAAAERAEEIRSALTLTPQQMLNGKCITASFGVSQLKDGESSTEFFVRADQALLNAKETGRNKVVQSNAMEGGANLKTADPTSLSGITWRKLKGKPLSQNEFATQTPMEVLIEKLRGYIHEQNATVDHVDDEHAIIRVEHENIFDPSEIGFFTVTIELQEGESQRSENVIGGRKMTYIRITIQAGKRGLFAKNANDVAPQVLSGLRRYLMINDETCRLKSVDPAVTKPGRR